VFIGALILLVEFAALEAALRFFSGSEAAPAFQSLFMDDPGEGYRLKPNARATYTTEEFSTDLAINAQGVRDDEPIGPKALGELLECARRRDGSPPPGPVRPVVDRESGSGLEAVYRLRLELPQVDSAALTLGRVDDDLIIGAGGMRRRVRLASVLRRCIVTDAQLRGSELTVRFRPNPEVWPA